MEENNTNEPDNQPQENKPTPLDQQGQEPGVGKQPEQSVPAAQPAEENTETWGKNSAEVESFNENIMKIRNEISKVIVGQDGPIELILTSIFADGHVLLEGVPGIAKTLMAKLVAQSLDIKFSRIQFTPDLMPTDVTGTMVFNMKSSEFTFNRGPLFSNVVLIDEINRAPAKTQAALFEVMEERQVTIDGETHPMDYPFFVIATQNPVEQEGTYKLPEAQLDRFLFKVKLHYPSHEDEKQILRKFRGNFASHMLDEVKPVLHVNDIKKMRDIIDNVHIKDALLDYIADIVHHTRNSGDLFLGASPRASLAILRSSKALAAIRGRDFVTPDDIQYVAFPALNHRIIVTPEREMEGVEAEDVITDIIKQIEVPR